MKKVIFSLSFFFVFASNLLAQQSPLIGFYTENELAISPSNAGIYDYSPIVINYRNQWNKLPGINSPSTFFLHTSSALDDNNSIGLVAYKDEFGRISNSGFEFIYAYRLPLNLDYNISFGLAPKLFFYGFNEKDVDIINPNDPTFNDVDNSEIIFDAKIGVSIYSDDLLLSLSADNIAQSSLRINDLNPGRNYLNRELKLYGNYRIQPTTNENIAFEPNLLAQISFNKQYQVSFGTDIIYKDLFYGGLMYRSKDAFGVRLGIRSKEIILGYQFEFVNSDIKSYQNGNHEIVLGYRLFNDKSSENNRWYDRHKKDAWIGKDSILKKVVKKEETKKKDSSTKKKKTTKKKTPTLRKKPATKRKSLG